MWIRRTVQDGNGGPKLLSVHVKVFQNTLKSGCCKILSVDIYKVTFSPVDRVQCSQFKT